MKKALLLFSFGCISLFSLCQPPVYWQKSFGGSAYDGRALVRNTSDKGFIVAGFGASADGDFAGANAGAFDMLMLKLDSCGNKQWATRYGAEQNDLIYGLAESPDKGYLFAGTTFSTSLAGYHGGVQDAILCKTDAAGNIQWTKLLGGTDAELLAGIIFLPDTSCVIAGWTGSEDGDGGPLHGDSDGWIIKLDKNGNTLWKKFFGSTEGDAFFDITASGDGGFVATGYSESGTDPDLYIVKIDVDGNTVWEKKYGGTRDDGGRTVRRAATGGYIVAGTTASPDGDVNGLHGNTDAWIIRIDENGNLLWQKCVGGTGAESLWEMIALPGDQFLFAAGTTSTDGDISNNQGSRDALAFSVSGNGSLQWARTYGGSSAEDFFGVSLAADGSPVLSGQSLSNNGDINENHGVSDFILFKLKDKIITQADTTACASLLLNNILVTRDTMIAVALKDQCGYNSAIIDYNIIITALPQVHSIPDLSIQPGDQVVLNTTATEPVQWSGAGLSCYTCLNPVARPVTDTRYIVSSGQGPCMAQDTVNIFVSLKDDTLFVPTAFTPDNNGRNDLFRAIGHPADFNMTIFNRWGEQLFQCKSVLQGWNGWYNGKPQPVGVYIYLIRYKTSSGIMKQMTGTIALIR